MTREEFIPLKEFCDNNGYELLNTDHEDNEKFFVIAKKKDPWAGVEFASYKFPHKGQFPSFKVAAITDQMLIMKDGVELFKGNCEPISEPVYVEQLKRGIMSRFDGQLHSDEIDDFNMDGGRVSCTPVSHVTDFFLYRKDTDTLYWAGIPVYQAGKWASRISKRIKVTPGFYKSKGDNSMKHMKCSFEVQNLKNSADTSGIMDFLSGQLEKLLNGEIN